MSVRVLIPGHAGRLWAGGAMLGCLILGAADGVAQQSATTTATERSSRQRQPATAKRQKARSGPSIVWVNEPKPGQLPLPPRTRHLTFHSKLVEQDVGFCLYLPPGYEQGNQRYPVIYNLHGNGGNEFTGLESIELLHRGITEGRWPKMIMVLPNGGQQRSQEKSHIPLLDCS